VVSSAQRGRALFALVSMTIAVAAVIVFRSAAYARHPELLAWAFTFDLTLTIPLLYTLFIVRGGRARAITIAPVFVVCVAAAARIVPADQQHFLHELRWIAAPLDVVSVWLVARRLARGSGTGVAIIDRVMASEIAILRYGLCSWRTKAPDGYTVHKESGWGAVVGCLLLVIAAESLGMHVLVQHWSVRAAWIVTAIDAYGALWLLGDYHALRLRPTTIEEGVLHLRYGLRWSADVPLANIAALEPVRSEWKRDGVLKIAMFDEPKLRIALHAPVRAIGFGGLWTREIDAIAIRPDHAEAFEAELRRALLGVHGT